MSQVVWQTIAWRNVPMRYVFTEKSDNVFWMAAVEIHYNFFNVGNHFLILVTMETVPGKSWVWTCWYEYSPGGKIALP